MSRSAVTSVCLATIVASLITLPARPAAADGDDPDLAYFFNGGAVPFVWGSALIGAFSLTMSPRDEPFGFSAAEGGLEIKGDTIPEYQVAMLAGVTSGLMAAPSRPARWFHLKGFAEAVLTTAAITGVTKNVVGRHRPSHSPGSNNLDLRRSFFSGHASITLATMTYFGLYLQRHVFAEWRPADSEIAWWEPIPLAALVAISAYVPYTRIDNNRHHPSDILTGAAVGTATAVAFYIYQERRFRDRRRRDKPSRITLAPTANGLVIGGSF